ncbi:hypothetical protein K450DRAFT_255440 [Umbelopsis ramanniana AG]|uniref:SAM-dependent MTase RsmB/NOP-type domain-containing protein n=1 Tax=Umbelopsis ramanniana AG TaxID=1314678 RepID=A0AAD5E4K9_UMBRA|nr:uncharacterized protein K450DRAFT_255440 [Umbelopsis ramanniana AG]KAI8576757.1 hypothetical protein K450DRAFT_255440 [Umbelopsis ramanniana AG]
MYAIVCETLKYKEALNNIIDTSKILTIEKKLPRTMALLLIHDLLFTKRGIQSSDGPLKQAVMRHKARLKAELVKYKIKMGAKSDDDLVSQKVKDAVLIPRYVRVNEHKTTVDKAIQAFIKEGYTLEEPRDDLSSLSKLTVRRDIHLNDLLVLPPNSDLHDHPMYISGELILQDKASCFPAHVCNPAKGSHIIDACAAPGNKTSHLSALVRNTGKIFAFDLDMRRLDLLKRLTNKAGCKNITPLHGSFLEVDPNDPKYAEVEYLLLDPSCSGSGIISRLDHLVDDEQEANGTERLDSLAEFQIAVIQHAMKFPKAKKVVYSTCSIHPQENEHVVKTILASTDDFVLGPRSEAIPTWKRRGLVEECNDDKDIAESVIRTNPSEDYTNGFFVACFLRKEATTDATNEQKRKIEGDAAEAPSSKKSKKKNKKKKKAKANIEPSL